MVEASVIGWTIVLVVVPGGGGGGVVWVIQFQETDSNGEGGGVVNGGTKGDHKLRGSIMRTSGYWSERSCLK